MSTIRSASDVAALDWAKGGGLLPAVVQDVASGAVLMLGYVNSDALNESLRSARMTFWSRSKQRLWTKGEASGHVLEIERIDTDCDADALLVLARPVGPTCHRGTVSCFDTRQNADAPRPTLAFAADLDALIAQRERERPPGSYTTRLFDSGVKRIAQKVGEEGVEVALAASGSAAELLDESADLLFHLLVLLRARGLGLADVVGILRTRHGDAVTGPLVTAVADSADLD